MRQIFQTDDSRGEIVSSPTFQRVLIVTQEIVLHTLFESGITRIHELERYIKDDVVRYGTRLSELEKKLTAAYEDAVRDLLHSQVLFLMLL